MCKESWVYAVIPSALLADLVSPPLNECHCPGNAVIMLVLDHLLGMRSLMCPVRPRGGWNARQGIVSPSASLNNDVASAEPVGAACLGLEDSQQDLVPNTL